jgi:hypothetical protein
LIGKGEHVVATLTVPDDIKTLAIAQHNGIARTP